MKSQHSEKHQKVSVESADNGFSAKCPTCKQVIKRTAYKSGLYIWMPLTEDCRHFKGLIPNDNGVLDAVFTY